MGAILNRFDELMRINNYQELKDKFRLTAVLVHNPKDRNLCKHVSNYFLNFAEATGNSLLFLTFIRPPMEIYEAIKRDQYQYAKIFFSDSVANMESERLIANALRSFYDIDDDMSYLVFGHSLSDETLYKVPVTVSSLSYQFFQMANYCNGQGNLDDLLNEMNAEAYQADETFGESLLQFASLISPQSINGMPGLYSEYQLDNAMRAITRLKSNLLKRLGTTDDEEEIIKDIIELYDFVEWVYAKSLKIRYIQRYYECDNCRMLDNLSRKFWRTYVHLSNAYKRMYNQDALDYSALILYLCKIVENELNLSVLQMLRHAMDIDMPQFYNLPCLEKGYISVRTESGEVAINDYIESTEGGIELKYKPIGNIMFAYDTLRRRGYGQAPLFPNRVYPLSDMLLHVIDEMRKYRNSAAHANTLHKCDLYQVQEYFDSFMYYFYELNDIKNHLAPQRVHFDNSPYLDDLQCI